MSFFVLLNKHLLKQCGQVDDFKGCSIKVIIKNKDNPMLFDLFMEKLEAADPMTIQVVTDHLHLDLEDDADIVDEAEDTLTILEPSTLIIHFICASPNLYCLNIIHFAYIKQAFFLFF